MDNGQPYGYEAFVPVENPLLPSRDTTAQVQARERVFIWKKM